MFFFHPLTDQVRVLTDQLNTLSLEVARSMESQAKEMNDLKRQIDTTLSHQVAKVMESQSKAIDDLRRKVEAITRLNTLRLESAEMTRIALQRFNIRLVKLEHSFLSPTFTIVIIVNLLKWAITWRRCFVNNFLSISLACIGSREAAEQQWNPQTTFYKTSSQINSPS